jgi:hypothetical protein
MYVSLKSLLAGSTAQMERGAVADAARAQI